MRMARSMVNRDEGMNFGLNGTVLRNPSEGIR